MKNFAALNQNALFFAVPHRTVAAGNNMLHLTDLGGQTVVCSLGRSRSTDDIDETDRHQHRAFDSGSKVYHVKVRRSLFRACGSSFVSKQQRPAGDVARRTSKMIAHRSRSRYAVFDFGDQCGADDGLAAAETSAVGSEIAVEFRQAHDIIRRDDGAQEYFTHGIVLAVIRFEVLIVFDFFTVGGNGLIAFGGSVLQTVEVDVVDDRNRISRRVASISQISGNFACTVEIQPGGN